MDDMEMTEYFGCPPIVGSPAPSFKAQAYCKDCGCEGDFCEYSLDDFKGKWLVLFFHPLAFTGVCASEVIALSNALDEFKARGAEVLGCSVDSQFTLKAWVESGQVGQVKIPLLSDLAKQIGADFGVLDEDKGINLRGLFIIDPEGVVQYSVVHPPAIGRSVDETLRVLDALQSGGACPANWKKGDS